MTHATIIHAIGSTACFAVVLLAAVALVACLCRAAGWEERQPEDAA